MLDEPFAMPLVFKHPATKYRSPNGSCTLYLVAGRQIFVTSRMADDKRSG